MKKVISLIAFVLISCVAFSQHMSIELFRCLENDLSARAAKVEDINNELCALIRLNTPERGFEFAGCNVEKVEQKTGEIWVFVSPGVKFITIKHRDFGAIINYPFPEQIKAGYVYEMKLRTARIKQIIEESITDQYLIIESETPDAKIYINNEYKGRNSAMEYLPLFQDHTYRVEAPLHHAKTGTIRLNENEKTVLSVNLDPAYGYLSINTTPVQGAEIEINGKVQKETTPFITQALESGFYNIQAFMPLYTSEPVRVQILDGQTTEVNINLVSTVSQVELICEDKDAEIHIDGEYRSKGVFRATLGEGIHRLEVKKANHRTFRKNLQIISGQPYTETISKLEAITGRLNLNSTPYGATIYIDGKQQGETPLLIPEILVGQHEVKLVKKGYKDLEDVVMIEEGKIAKYNFNLESTTPQEPIKKQEPAPQQKPTPQPKPAPKPASAPATMKEPPLQKEKKIRPKTDWIFNMNAGYALDQGGEDARSSSGINAGLKLSCKPGGLGGLGFMASADMFYLGLNQNDKNDMQDIVDVHLNDYGYDNYKITQAKYYCFPVMFGLNYDLKLGSQFKIFAEAGAGLSISKKTNETHTFTRGNYNGDEIVTYPIETGVAFNFGGGVELFKTLTLGVDYYVIKKLNTSKLALKIGINF